MIKENISIYKMPYFNIAEQILKYVPKEKHDFQEIVCVCFESGCDLTFEGYKYEFSYSANPTIEPVSYKLKGQTQESSVNYNDIGIDINSDVHNEIANKISNILTIVPDSIENNIFSYPQNNFTNQSLNGNIFQRNKSFFYRNEVYNDTGYYDDIITSLKIISNIYTVNINQSYVKWN